MLKLYFCQNILSRFRAKFKQMKQALVQLFTRDLGRLTVEMETYRNPDNMWLSGNGISNSAGNLCLHLVGNLNHFIGTVLGKTGYQRKREEEFSQKNIPLPELVAQVANTIDMLKKTLNEMKEDDFHAPFPVPFNNQDCTTDFVLIHLAGHLNYHLGQINYHRRLLDK